MYKNICKVLCLMTFVFIIYFPNGVLAKPVNVLECPDGDAECLENISKLADLETDEEQPLEVKQDESIFLKLLQMFFALFIVLALIYLLIKFLSNRNSFTARANSLENIGGISIGQNKSIQLVRVGTHVYMIGVGDNVELLQEITDEQLKVDLLHKKETNSIQSKNIFSSLKSFMSDQKKKPAKTKADEQFKNLFSSELTKLKETRTEIQEQQREDRHE